MIRHIRRMDAPEVAWRNGRGSTRELVMEPDGAAADDFAWRISVATIFSDGPFSHIDGVDRTLTVIAGGDLTLNVARKVIHCLPWSPAKFSGGAPVAAESGVPR